MGGHGAILFDWDGTLIDSYPAGFLASMAVAERFGIPFDRQRFLETYSPNWYHTYRVVGLPETEWDTADRIWLACYAQQVSELYPFARDTLSVLRGSGYQLGIVTSGNRTRVQAELARFGLTETFAVVICHEDADEKKPHPQPLLNALRSLGRKAAETAYVGDRPEDVEMGARAGAFTVAVESQYSTRSVLEQASPNLLLPDAGHLPGHFGPLSEAALSF